MPTVTLPGRDGCSCYVQPPGSGYRAQKVWKSLLGEGSQILGHKRSLKTGLPLNMLPLDFYVFSPSFIHGHKEVLSEACRTSLTVFRAQVSRPVPTIGPIQTDYLEGTFGRGGYNTVCFLWGQRVLTIQKYTAYSLCIVYSKNTEVLFCLREEGKSKKVDEMDKQ